MSKTRKCKQCKCIIEISYRNPNQQYCSRNCLHKSQRKRVALICPTCHQKFEAPKNRLKGRKSVHCSRACYAKSKRGVPPANKNQIEYECIKCGKHFFKPPSAKAKFCGRKCYHTWHKRYMKENPSNPRKTVARTCETCQKTFNIWPSHAEREGYNQGRFCSRDCFSAWKRTVTGESHPLYKERVEKTCDWCKDKYHVKPCHADTSRFCSRRCHGSYMAANMDRMETKIERLVRQILSKHNIPYQQEKRIGPWVCDFVIESHNLAAGYSHDLSGR